MDKCDSRTKTKKRKILFSKLLACSHFAKIFYGDKNDIGVMLKPESQTIRIVGSGVII